jgi:hypothetical protein
MSWPCWTAVAGGLRHIVVSASPPHVVALLSLAEAAMKTKTPDNFLVNGDKP